MANAFKPASFFELPTEFVFVSKHTSRETESFLVKKSATTEPENDKTKQLETELAELKRQLEIEKRQAFDEGFKEGQSKAAEDLEQFKQSLTNRLEAFLQDLSAQHTEIIKEIERKAIMLGIELASALLDHSIKYRPEYLFKFLEKGLSFSSLVKIREIAVSPEDYQFLVELGLKNFGQFKEIDIKPDQTIKAGCVVKTSSGEIIMDPFEIFKDLTEEVFSKVKE